MKICQVIRPLVATNRIANLEHKHLQVVRDGSTDAVAVDKDWDTSAAMALLMRAWALGMVAAA